MPTNDPRLAIGFDPGSPNGAYAYQYAQRLTTVYENNSKGFSQLTPRELLDAIRGDLLTSIRDERDSAKLLYEEEADEVSFGEYMALERMIKTVEKYIEEAPSRIYNIPKGSSGRMTYSLDDIKTSVYPKTQYGGGLTI